jgi:membrane fusion protein, multidrug efflux system
VVETSSAPGGETDSGEPERNSRRSKRALLILATLAILAGAAWFAYWYIVARFRVTTDDAYLDAQIVEIAPQESGNLIDLPVESNTHVSQGDLLARIDPAANDAALAQAEASLEKARTGVLAAQAQLEQAHAAVDRQRSASRAARVTADNARKVATRYRTIVSDSPNSPISEQEVETAEADAASADAQAAEAESAVAGAQVGIRAAQASLDSARADQAVAEANLEAARVSRSHMTIKAPIDGEIVQRNVGLGSFVSPGTQMMALVPDHIYITANYKETQLQGIRPGLAVDIEVDAYPDRRFRGEVVSIQRGAGQAFQLLPPRNARGNFVKVVQRVPVRISIEPEEPGDYVLGPGMSVVPTIHLDQP